MVRRIPQEAARGTRGREQMTARVHTQDTHTESTAMHARFRWTRAPENPVLPPDPNSMCESTRCMNPFVVRVGDEYRLFYCGNGYGATGIGTALAEHGVETTTLV